MLLGCKAGLISLGPYNQWIGLRENLHRKPMGFYHQIDRAFRLKFSHHPILSWFLWGISMIDMMIDFNEMDRYLRW